MNSLIARPDAVSGEDYWHQTKRPLVSLVFLLPLLAVYEWGVWSLGGRSSDALRNGADLWMRDGLSRLGIPLPWLLPFLVIGGLLAWHWSAKDRWQFSLDTLPGMLAESVVFAFLLMLLGRVTDWSFGTFGLTHASVGSNSSAMLAITFVGAGIYEEVMFRLCLLPAVFGLLRGVKLNARWAAGCAVVITSLVFSEAHYVGPMGDTFHWFTFTFRTMAGLFFSVLFVYRGFGVTVGCHAAYDLLVGVLLP